MSSEDSYSTYWTTAADSISLLPSSLRYHAHRPDCTLHSKVRKGGVADVVPDEQSRVWGLLYQVTPADLRSLDGYEGSAYERTETVFREIVDPEEKETPQAPSEGYLKEGGRDPEAWEQGAGGTSWREGEGKVMPQEI